MPVPRLLPAPARPPAGILWFEQWLRFYATVSGLAAGRVAGVLRRDLPQVNTREEAETFGPAAQGLEQ